MVCRACAANEKLSFSTCSTMHTFPLSVPNWHCHRGTRFRYSNSVSTPTFNIMTAPLSPTVTGIGGRFRYSNSIHPYFQHQSS